MLKRRGAAVLEIEQVLSDITNRTDIAEALKQQRYQCESAGGIPESFQSVFDSLPTTDSVTMCLVYQHDEIHYVVKVTIIGSNEVMAEEYALALNYCEAFLDEQVEPVSLWVKSS